MAQQAEQTVVTVMRTGGRYDARHVHWLLDQCRQMAEQPFRFVCLSDDPAVPGYVTLRQSRQGWWPKMEVFRADLAPAGSAVLFLDLDTVAMRPFRVPVLPAGVLGMLELGGNWYTKVGSGLMAWTHPLPRMDAWLSDRADALTDLLPGDQEAILAAAMACDVRVGRISDLAYVQPFPSARAVPYTRLPRRSFFCFAGDGPKPWDLTRDWIPALPATAASDLPATAPLSVKPKILHVMPWDLTVGGGQRMLDDWCRTEGHRWHVRIATMGASPGTFEFPGATVVRVGSAADLARECRAFAPAVVAVHNCDHPACAGVADHPAMVWFAHGERILANPRPQWARPLAVMCNYPQPPHPTWNDVPRHVVRLGVDTARFAPAPLAVTYAPRPGLVAGIVGRLSPEKVPESFLAALKRWEPGPWRILFVGAGIRTPYHDRIRKDLAGLSWVEFAGDVSPDAMPDAYRQLDAVLVPSVTETGSYALAEAMACGLPVVCRDLPGPRFTAGDAPAFAATDDELLAALAALADAHMRESMAKASRAAAESSLSLDRQMSRQTAVYAAAAAPRVSLLMPVWNSLPNFIEEAVASVQAQTEPLWELVVVDDGSDNQETIDTMALLAGGDPRIRLLRLGHGGVGSALRYGLPFCRAELVARMDSDDAMVPDRLAIQLAYLRDHPEVTVVGGQIKCVGAFGHTELPEVIDRQYAQTHTWLMNHPTTMFRKAAVLAVGNYDATLRAVEDLDLWLRLLNAGHVLRNLPIPLVRYRLHKDQVTRNNPIQEIAEVLRARHGYPLLRGERNLGPVFDDIYRVGKWGKPMSSGQGSEPPKTGPVAPQVSTLLRRRQLLTMLDVGCGTSGWLLDAAHAGGIVRYLGVDVSPVAVASRAPCNCNTRFHVADLTHRPIDARADIAVCRDVMTHLPLAHGVALLRNVAQSTGLLLATDWPEVRENREIKAGEWRPINLRLAPYLLPEPIAVIREADAGKTLALFNLKPVPGMVPAAK